MTGVSEPSNLSATRFWLYSTGVAAICAPAIWSSLVLGTGIILSDEPYGDLSGALGIFVYLSLIGFLPGLVTSALWAFACWTVERLFGVRHLVASVAIALVLPTVIYIIARGGFEGLKIGIKLGLAGVITALVTLSVLRWYERRGYR